MKVVQSIGLCALLSAWAPFAAAEDRACTMVVVRVTLDRPRGVSINGSDCVRARERRHRICSTPLKRLDRVVVAHDERSNVMGSIDTLRISDDCIEVRLRARPADHRGYHGNYVRGPMLWRVVVQASY
jgi:hypothetical protein